MHLRFIAPYTSHQAKSPAQSRLSMMPMSADAEAMPIVRQNIKDFGSDIIGSFIYFSVRFALNGFVRLISQSKGKCHYLIAAGI